MEDIIEYPALLMPEEPRHPIDLQSEVEARLAMLSHFGSPYCEGDTPLFI